MAVPRTKRRIYNRVYSIGAASSPPSRGTGYTLLHHSAPHSTQETFLRLRADAEVRVAVSAPGFVIPPEFWWAQTTVELMASWLPSNSTTPQPIFGTSSNFLGSVALHAARYPLETNPGEYVVTWVTKEPLITETARQSPTATTGPGILLELKMDDPEFVFSQGWADTSINFYGSLFTLWEDPA